MQPFVIPIYIILLLGVGLASTLFEGGFWRGFVLGVFSAAFFLLGTCSAKQE